LAQPFTEVEFIIKTVYIMDFPTIITPNAESKWKVQTASYGNQVPFYFGGSTVPNVIGIARFKPIRTESITMKPSVKINQQLLRY
jgi:hypothetical protein